jgi:hypothetical protein
MASDITVEGGDDSWGLDQEIRQIAHLTKAWRNHADIYCDGDYGALVDSIAAGYALHLEMLREARARLNRAESCASDLASFNNSARIS